MGKGSQSFSFKVKCIFMHDNAPSYVSKLTHKFFGHTRFTDETIMKLPSTSPDPNPIKNVIFWFCLITSDGSFQIHQITSIIDIDTS